MNKQSLILKYFQKADQLIVENPIYCSTISSLFRWLVENDKAGSDISTRLLGLKSRSTAKIISRQEGVIAGLEEVSYLAKKHTSLSFKPLITDGKTIKSGQTITKLKGIAFAILSVERTILNILQRMSGIATETSRLIHLINLQPKTYNLKPFIAATRKTPWMSLDKKAVAIGGGLTHRLNLFDGILIKDNHLKVLQKQYKLKTTEEAIEKALKTHREWAKHSPGVKESPQSLIEIEVETPNQAYLALQTWNRIHTNNDELITNNHLAIMFDNFSPDQVKTILSNLSDLDRSQIIFEASGGIDETNIRQWAKTGVDIISIGSLTHSPKAVNFSLEIY